MTQAHTFKTPLATASRRKLLQAGVATAALGILGAPAIVRAQAGPKIRIGYWPIAAGLPFYSAIELGYFKEAGLNVEVLKFAGAQQVMEAMLSGPMRRQRQRHGLGQHRHGRDCAARHVQDFLLQSEQRQERPGRSDRARGQYGQSHGGP
jgi:hypothetical protein